MNTGIQQSSLTPFGASTTTSPAGDRIHGSANTKKDMFDIVAAHKIKYAATASIGIDCGLWFLAEYENGQYKLNKDIKEFSSVKEYLKKQKRFKHLNDEDIKIIEDIRNKKWKDLRDKVGSV